MLDTLSNVKSRLGITTSDYDTFLTQQIQLVSDTIEAYCRRKFLTATYEQTFYWDDEITRRNVSLFHYPVSSVASVSVNGADLDPSEYRLNTPSGVLTKPMGYPFFYPFSETVITYTAGYDTCPTPILAVLDGIVGERYNKKANGIDLNFGSDVQRISIPGAISIDFDYTLTNNDRSSAYGTILGNYVNILDDWRSERTILGSGKLEYVEEQV